MNKTIFKKMNGLIQHDYPEFKGLIDLGSFTIYTVHSALGKALNSMALKLIFFVLYALFQHSAARHEDYVGVQVEMEVDTHIFQQHT